TAAQFKNIFLLGFGLCVVEILSSLSTNIPRYILEEFHSVEVLGIFATIMYFTVITNNIVMAINEGVIANLSRESMASIRKFYRSFFKLCIMFSVLIIIGEIILILYGNDIVILVYGSEFIGLEREMILLGVLLVFVVYSKILEMALSILNLYKQLVFIQMLTFVSTLVLSLIVIIPYGLTGAFIVAIITLSLMVAGQIGVLIHHWQHQGQFEYGGSWNMIIIWLAALFYIVIGFLMQHYITDTTYLTFSFIIFTVIVLFFVLFINYTKFVFILFSGFILRVMILLIDLREGETIIPHSGDDSENFYKTGIEISMNTNLLNSEVYGGLYSKFLGILFHLYGDDRLFVQFLNIIITMTAILIVIQIFRMLDIPGHIQMILVLLLSFYPHSLIFSSILVRESMISITVVLSLYFFV